MKIMRGTIYGTNKEVKEYINQYTKIKDILKGRSVCPFFGKSSCDRDCSFCVKTCDDYSDEKIEICTAKKVTA